MIAISDESAKSALDDRRPMGLRPNEVQVYAWATDGSLMHAGTRPRPRRVSDGVLRRWAREWRKWALASVPADCPTGVTVRTKRHGSWRVEYQCGTVVESQHPRPVRRPKASMPGAKSVGHLAFLAGSREAYEGADGEVYIAPVSCPTAPDGRRMGARWECSRAHWNRYAPLGVWPIEAGQPAKDGTDG